MDIQGVSIHRVESLLREMQDQGGKADTSSAADSFYDLLQAASNQSTQAGQAAEHFVTTGEGELHRVQLELAKADVTFRFLLEVRNKLTEAYQEISRLSM